MTYITPDQEREAYELGVTAAKNAASWAYDGDMSRKDIELRVRMLDEGDPEVYDFLPRKPNLREASTPMIPRPLSIAREVLGDSDPEGDREQDPDVVDAIADAWERGVDDTFGTECERVLRAAYNAAQA